MKSLPTLRAEIVGVLAALALASCASLQEGRGTPATPQRPTLSTDTATTAEGTLELETGIALDPGDRLGTPSTLKLGLDARSEAFLGFEPWIVLDERGDDETGHGDLLLGYRRRFVDASGDAPALAYLGALKAPTADEDDGLGSGETDVFAALAATWSGSTWTKTGYAQLGLLGDPGGGVLLQSAASFTAGYPLQPDLSAFGELAVSVTPEIDDEQLLATLGLAKAWAPGRVVDLGFVVGFGEDAPDFQLLLGTTLNLGRVFAP